MVLLLLLLLLIPLLMTPPPPQLLQAAINARLRRTIQIAVNCCLPEQVLWELATKEVPRRGFVQPPPPSEDCPQVGAGAGVGLLRLGACVVSMLGRCCKAAAAVVAVGGTAAAAASMAARWQQRRWRRQPAE